MNKKNSSENCDSFISTFDMPKILEKVICGVRPRRTLSKCDVYFWL